MSSSEKTSDRRTTVETQAKRGRCQQAPEAFILETDFPPTMPIGNREVEAIERLLGADLDRLLLS